MREWAASAAGTYVGQSLVLFDGVVVGGEERLLHLIEVVLQLLELLLELVYFVLSLRETLGG